MHNLKLKSLITVEARTLQAKKLPKRIQKTLTLLHYLFLTDCSVHVCKENCT